MLETVDLDAAISKSEFEDIWKKLEIRLGQLQRDLRAAGIPAVIVLEGWDAAGKGRVLNAIMQALDPRGFAVHHMELPSGQESHFPVLRRYWLRLPPQGSIAVFDLSWHHEVIETDVQGALDRYARERAYERIRQFERQLANSGCVVLKFFFHITQDEQSKRLKKLRGKTETAWKAGDPERRRNKRYPDYIEPIETCLRETMSAHAPWTLVPATNRRFATLYVAETIAAAFEHALQAKGAAAEAPAAPAPKRRTGALTRVDPGKPGDAAAVDADLDALQQTARDLQYGCFQKRVPVTIVFEGWDTAGKGGAIRRLTKELDPRGYTVVPVAAPEGIERRHHYLWRFWKMAPEAGHWAIFDRSWYGRVLVERVEGLCTVAEWQRAFEEINEFEEQLAETGGPIFKFWLHITPEEQLGRLKERQKTPHKQWKITEDDWRNRAKWDEYAAAAADMIERTSTPHAPWTIVEANDKGYARKKVLLTVTEGVAKALR